MPGQQALQVGRLRRGPVEWNGAAVDADAGGAHDARRQAGRAEDRLEQVRGGRLAVGPGHTDKREAFGRPGEERGGHRTHRPPDLRHDDLCARDGHGTLDDDGNGAGGLGRRGEVVSVHMVAGHAEEERARAHVARAVRDVRDGGLVDAVVPRACTGDRGREPGKRNVAGRPRRRIDCH